MPAGFRDFHIRPAGESHRRQRRRIGDGETLAGDKGVVGKLAIEFGEETVQPGATAISEFGSMPSSFARFSHMSTIALSLASVPISGGSG